MNAQPKLFYLKKMIKTAVFALLLAFILFSVSCSFGEKTDETIDDINRELYTINNSSGTGKSAVQFVNVARWSGTFSKPSDVLFGYDKTVYVSDRGNNVVYQLDENGVQIGQSGYIKNPTKLAMDRKLNLFVICTVDSTINKIPYSFSAIYYLNMHSTKQLLRPSTEIAKKIIYPFYNSSIQRNFNSATQVKFVGISTYADNTFIVARTGPDNNDQTKNDGFDNTIIQFDSNQNYAGNLSGELAPTGSGLKTIYNPVAIASFANPPQSNSVSKLKDFLIGMVGSGENSSEPDNYYKVQGINVILTGEDIFYEAERKFLSQDTSKTSRFLFSFVKRNGVLKSRFIKPNDIAITNENNKQYIFVVDTELDSLYQFSYSGEEGIPVFGSKNAIVSFGGRPAQAGNYSAFQFEKPEGVAFGNNRLYVADTGNRRVLVYKLSTDIVGQ